MHYDKYDINVFIFCVFCLWNWNWKSCLENNAYHCFRSTVNIRILWSTSSFLSHLRILFSSWRSKYWWNLICHFHSICIFKHFAIDFQLFMYFGTTIFKVSMTFTYFSCIYVNSVIIFNLSFPGIFLISYQLQFYRTKSNKWFTTSFFLFFRSDLSFIYSHLYVWKPIF